MPAYCAPSPVKRKAIRGTTSRRLAGGGSACAARSNAARSSAAFDTTNAERNGWCARPSVVVRAMSAMDTSCQSIRAAYDAAAAGRAR